jgi:hypothetical protein
MITILIIISLIIVLLLLLYIFYKNNGLQKNIHNYAIYDKRESKNYYYQKNPFFRPFESVYMSDTVKNEIFKTIDNFTNNSSLSNNNNLPRSLRIIISGKEGIGKTTLVEAISTFFNYGIIHFPKNNYSEKMIHEFFNDINCLPMNNIILFNNINFNIINKKNKQLYNLLCSFVNKNDKNNIFIFTFNNLDDIFESFSSNFRIHNHYYMDVHINHIMKLVGQYINDVNKLIEIKHKFLLLNHKLTPGYIIPYLSFNENFEKSLDRFFKIIKY